MEIKFRVWDKKTNQMGKVWAVYFSDSDELETVYVHLPKGLVTTRNINDCIVMQSTGLKDKNGVEIYDGDIYRYKYYTGGGFEYRNSIVEWEITEIAYEGVFHGYELSNYEIEVIGNIYENQELLTEG